MEQVEFFPEEKDYIAVRGLDTMLDFARFRPNAPDLFLDGLELAEDLQFGPGIVLYTRGTALTRERITRLLQFREDNPAAQFDFKIKRSLKLIQSLHKEMKSKILQSFKRNQEIKDYHELLNGINFNIDDFISELLAEEKIVLTFYYMYFLCESSEKKRSVYFLEHSINVAFFSLAMVSSDRFSNIIQKEKTRIQELFKVALFHNFGALEHLDRILELPEEEQQKQYWKANHKGYFTLGGYEFDFGILDSIRLVCEYFMGRKDFISRSRWPELMANIVLVAETFLRTQTGLFDSPQPARQTIDQLNVRAMEKDLYGPAVESLTLGLNLRDIFDFYQEMDSLIKECPNSSACPYPLTGFKSPTIIICKNTVRECEHLEYSIKAVVLVKPLKEIQPGTYHRCKLLTPRLMSFYDRYYEEIKDK